MKIIKFAQWTSMGDFIAGKPADVEFSDGWDGIVAECLRAAADQAKTDASTAGGTAATLGSEAQGEQAQLQPFYTGEMHAEHGFDPTQTNELLTHALAGTGGATGALTGQADLEAARTRNPSGFTKSLDEVARDQQKTAAGASEGIAAQDVMGAKALNQEGAAGEMGLQGENLKGQLEAMGLQNQDLNTEIDANKTGWLQNMDQTISALGGAASGAASLKKAF